MPSWRSVACSSPTIGTRAASAPGARARRRVYTHRHKDPCARKRPRRTKAGTVTLFEKEMPQLSPELPLDLARRIPTTRAPLEDGVGLACWLVDEEGKQIVLEVPGSQPGSQSSAYRLERIGETRDYTLLLGAPVIPGRASCASTPAPPHQPMPIAPAPRLRCAAPPSRRQDN